MLQILKNVVQPVWYSWTGAAHESVHEREEEDEQEERSVEINGEGLVAEIGDVRLQHALVHRVHGGQLEVPEHLDDDSIGDDIIEPDDEGEEDSDSGECIGMRDNKIHKLE